MAAGRAIATPTVLQMEAVECGAACLAMILGHYGRWVPLEELRIACGVSRDGTKASNLVRAARALGMEAKGYKKEPAALREMRMPVVVFWNFNHFVVVEGFEGAAVRINDPAGGRRSVSAEEFDQSFTGVVLAMSPGADFKPAGARPSVLAALRRRFAGAGQAIALLVICGLALVLPGLVVPVFGRIFVDDILVAGRQDWLRPLLLGMALTALLRIALTALEQHILLRVGIKMALATSARFFWHMLRLPVAFFTQRSPGEIGSRVALNDDVAQILTEDFAATLLAIVTSIFFCILMFFYDVVLTLVVIGAAAANAAALHFVSQRNRELNRRLSIDGGKLMGASMNGLTIIETIKSSGHEHGFFSRWAGYQTKFLNSLQEMTGTALRLSTVPAVLNSISAALVLGIGALKVMDGHMSMGMLVAFQSLAASFAAPVGQLVGIAAKLQQAQGDMDRLDDVMRFPADELTREHPAGASAPPGRLEGRLELRNLTFGYSRAEAPLLDDFSLSVGPGQRIALVGPSGCGKSTVAKLIMGLYQPWSGEILFDGRPRSAYERYALVNSVGMVDQDIVLFSGSIRDNIAMWDATLAEADVLGAARDACIHEVIVERPGGYDARIEEGGHNFSGGQRQRLEIARALANDPRLLVLDEATSALDPATEKQFDDNLRRRGCACVIVAHRLSTIRDADEIVVMRRGRIVQRGTHESLMREPQGFYATLVRAE
jgi:NHLM bacteriocin system ABC transporter peptidase/ATP-binding protein